MTPPVFADRLETFSVLYLDELVRVLSDEVGVRAESQRRALVAVLDVGNPRPPVDLHDEVLQVQATNVIRAVESAVPPRIAARFPRPEDVRLLLPVVKEGTPTQDPTVRVSLAGRVNGCAPSWADDVRGRWPHRRGGSPIDEFDALRIGKDEADDVASNG